jgi:hypothetical protein
MEFVILLLLDAGLDDRYTFNKEEVLWLREKQYSQ